MGKRIQDKLVELIGDVNLSEEVACQLVEDGYVSCSEVKTERSRMADVLRLVSERVNYQPSVTTGGRYLCLSGEVIVERLNEPGEARSRASKGAYVFDLERGCFQIRIEPNETAIRRPKKK